MRKFDKFVVMSVKKDIDTINQVGSMYGLIEWWAVTDNEGTGLSGRDQWQFVTHSYPVYVEWLLKQWLEDRPHPMHDRRIHWRDIDDRDVMEEYIEEMGGIDNI